ncbi:MAG: cation diffusion facilitator family transporter [Candidatus Cryptobacteroides sp.]
MGHNHSHSHNQATRNISTAFFLNAFFVVFELAGGLITNSMAILSDAVHDFGDCLSLAVSWALEKKAAKGRDYKYSYGYRRFSLLGSLFLSLVLVASSTFVIIESVKRISSPQEVSAKGMLIMAVFGVIINGASALSVKRGSSMNERSVFLHIMEDVLGWIGVLVTSLVMMFVNVPVLDPLLSLGISIWVLYNVASNLVKVFRILLQGVPENVPLDTLKEEICNVSGVCSIHDLHIWSMDGESHIMTVHVVTDGDIEPVKKQIIDIAARYGIVHTTIQFEGSSTCCTNSCD